MLAALLLALSLVLQGGAGDRPPDPVSVRTDRFWEQVAQELLEKSTLARDKLKAELDQWVTRLPPGTMDSPSLEGEKTRIRPVYGLLPEVYVDPPESAVFPRAPTSHQRHSWHEVALNSLQSLRNLEEAGRLLQESSKVSTPDLEARVTLARRIAVLWSESTRLQIQAAEETRHLTTWSAPLLEQHLAGMPSRQATGPGKRRKQPFLPEHLIPGKAVVIPIVTDVKDVRFRRELEGALDQHWSRSNWARERDTRFQIRWLELPENPDFRQGRVGLDAHLSRFPKDKAALTTGGLSTFVRGTALVLGPGRITVRSLAHELGHLMGFGDCYSRSLVSNGRLGLLGLAVIERDNPESPDDLMCDDSVGVPRKEVW